MRAIIIATGMPAHTSPLRSEKPISLLPLLDRPFLEYIVEFLTWHKVAEIAFVATPESRCIEQALGDGARWGRRFTYHISSSAVSPYAALRDLGLDSGSRDRVLFGHADRLPILSSAALNEKRQKKYATLFVAREEKDEEAESWTGWGLLMPHQLLAIPQRMREDSLDAYLLSAFGPTTVLSEIKTMLSVQTPAHMLRSQRTALERHIPGLLLNVQEKEFGIWVSPKSTVDPSAKLVAPVLIGPNCLVSAGAQVGPNTVVGAGSILAHDCRVRNATIFPDTYVGRGLSVDGLVLAKNLVVTPSDNSSEVVADPLILGTVSRTSLLHLLGGLFRGLTALVLWILMLPVGGVRFLFGLGRRPALAIERDDEELPYRMGYRTEADLAETTPASQATL
jgi:NDP-sugar pyrophosphorylase family protein